MTNFAFSVPRLTHFLAERCKDYLSRRSFTSDADAGHAVARQIGKSPDVLRRIGNDPRFGCAWYVVVNGIEMKAFQVYSPERWGNVQALLTGLRRAGVHLPTLLAADSYKRMIFCSWESGNPVQPDELAGNDGLVESMATYQAELHGAKIDAEPLGFRHLSDVVFPRLRRWIAVRYDRAARAELFELVATAESALLVLKCDLEITATNPDFVAANLLRDRAGRLVIIDNEFLCSDYGWEFDLSLTLDSLKRSGSSVCDKYLAAYGRTRSLSGYFPRKKVWDSLVVFKSCGKALSFFRTDPRLVYEQLMSTREVFNELHA